MRATLLPDDQVSFQHQGSEILRYRFGGGWMEPFVFAGADPGVLRLLPPRVGGSELRYHSPAIQEAQDGDDRAWAVVSAVWRDPRRGKPVLAERRVVMAHLPPQDDGWLLCLEQELAPAEGDVVLDSAGLALQPLDRSSERRSDRPDGPRWVDVAGLTLLLPLPDLTDARLRARAGSPLKLRFGVHRHSGAPPGEAIDALWRYFVTFQRRNIPAGGGLEY